jgi:hypothetical protein
MQAMFTCERPGLKLADCLPVNKVDQTVPKLQALMSMPGSDGNLCHHAAVNLLK